MGGRHMALKLLSRARISKTATKRNFRADIQGLRMIAVVAVVLDHLVGWPSGGFVGVDVFFVISGFLITGLLLREHDRTGTISFTGFYRNRIRRIAPAATLVLAVTVLGAWLLFNQARFQSTLGDSIWGFFFAANWHFAAAGTDYFQASGPVSPLQHYWSLAVEEQFYFVWPWLMLLIFVLVGRRAEADKVRARRAAAAVLIVVCAASFAWAMWETANNPTWAYFSTFSRAWELGVGALIAVFSPSFRTISYTVRKIMSYAGLAGILVSLFVVSGESAFPAPWAALPVLATAAVIIAGTGDHSAAPGLLTNRISGYLGDISYSLYLWHFPAIIFVSTAMGNGQLQSLIAAALALVTAIYSYHLVENPIRKSNWLKPEAKLRGARRQGLSEGYKITALSLLALVAAGLVGTLLLSKPPTYDAVAAPAIVTPSAGAKASTTPKLDALQAELAAALKAKQWPELNPSIDSVIGSQQAPSDVMRCGDGKVSFDEGACTWGDPNATKTIVTVGDSISMTYVAALRSAIGNTSGWSVTSYGMFGCPFTTRAEIGTRNVIPEGCTDRPDAAVQAINRIKPQMVIFSGSTTGTDEQIKKITAPSTFVFLPGPPADKNIAECYNKLSSPEDCITTMKSDFGSTDRRLASQYGSRGFYLDSSPWFCSGNSCPSFAGGIPMKLDKVHMTEAYAQHIGPAIRESLEAKKLL
ncbi:acyltransferase family protein [Pseudarthrobacter sp. LT1]|uniref:acyltransferase family protein n=1 Tax=Pseudarthrobacter sp. LT1 TaxID=3111450 RepID=UPI002D78C5B4|nr:acyltransferase family protein [Pseudarthrobacter sp. LT1]WRT14642.1 acyltransferase family protein [Pseudarthrobacter sp. LT1]